MLPLPASSENVSSSIFQLPLDWAQLLDLPIGASTLMCVSHVSFLTFKLCEQVRRQGASRFVSIPPELLYISACHTDCVPIAVRREEAFYIRYQAERVAAASEA